LFVVILALGACGGASPPIEPPPDALDVEVGARVGAPGVPAAWSARAAWGPTTPAPRFRPGVCRRPETGVSAPEAKGAPVAEAVTVKGPAEARLVWDHAHGLFTAEGPRQMLDPAWGIGDLQWSTSDGASHSAEGVVRFGAMPEVTRVTRDREGNVSLAWDPATVRDPEVHVRGPGGELVCGARADGTQLPWWAVPAYGGEVVLRSSHAETGVIDGTLLRVRSTLERIVPLDAPGGTTANEKLPPPPRNTPTTPIPRRLLRAPRSPMG
jgi:hypothetical protein